MFPQALRVAVALALFRGDPADMPYSLPLTRLCAALAAICSVVLMAPFAPLPLAVATGAGGVAGVVFFTRQLLRGRKLESRLLQTLAAQLLMGSLFALVIWPAFAAMAPVMQALMKDGDALAKMQSGQQLDSEPPVWAALWSDIVFIWSLAAAARVNRLAAALNQPASWLLTLLSLFVLTGFVLMAQIIVAILFR